MSEAVELVGKLLDCYPNRSQAGRGYIGALASVLASYPASVARRSADPLHGIPAEKTFGLPAVADLVKWCEDQTAELRGIVDREDHFGKLEREQQQRAEEEAKQIKARAARPTYGDLKAKHGENWGIRQGSDDDKAARTRSGVALEDANRKLLVREWAGKQPPEAAPGMPISKALHAQLTARAAEAAE
jgi:hypothetical protein